VAEVHVYQVNKLFGCANWIAMKLRMRSGDRVYNCEPDMHPDRDDYNHLEYDSHQAQMIAFVQELEALRAKYGIEMDYESCYECGGMARWQLGAVTVNVGDEDAWWRRESS
jgi:hypothetical protein